MNIDEILKQQYDIGQDDPRPWNPEAQDVKEAKAALSRLIAQARIDGINEAHKAIMEYAYAYTGEGELADFCGVDDLSRVTMSWKVKRIAELEAGSGEAHR